MKRLLPLILLIATALTSCVKTTEKRTWQNVRGVAWNTTYNITYCAPHSLSDSVTAVMRRVELSLSPFDPASRISVINRGDTLATDPLIERVLDISKRVNIASSGAFDPTLAPLINLWGFGYTDASGEPAQEVIDSCLQMVGIADCYIAGGQMVKKSPATQFNFSAVTKGFGCDLVGRALADAGCENYMVEIGGEIALRGHNKQDALWRVQIDAPIENTPGEHQRMAVIELTDCGIATSGNYRNYHLTADGNRVGHTISPVTGRPVVTSTLSATVIAPTCAEADALATACMAMDAADALAMIDALGKSYSAMLVIAPDNPNDDLTIRTTALFPELR